MINNLIALKIITVEDSPIVIDRVQSLLNEISSAEFKGNATNISSALNLIKVEQPDVVILDISLEEDKPKASGINLLIDIRKKYPDLIIIMFTNLSEPQYRNSCMALGANYFFDKSNEFEKITEVLKEVIKNREQVKKLAI
jgi:DNA-binding NarL/FixJ family response regulator